MIREELKRLGTWEELHSRLASRLLLVLMLTAVFDGIGTALVYSSERSAKQTEIHTVSDAFFFTTVQLLTVSSQIKNPLSVAGRAVDVFLEIWAVLVVAGSAGAIASSSRRATRSKRAIQNAFSGWAGPLSRVRSGESDRDTSRKRRSLCCDNATS
jgi:hypothetical protein